MAEDEDSKIISNLDPYHRHEVLHVSSVIADMFDRHIEQHAFTRSDSELIAAAEQIGELLGEFYQLVGRKTSMEETPDPAARDGS